MSNQKVWGKGEIVRKTRVYDALLQDKLVDVFRIKYRSDGLLVTGFLLQPQKLKTALPLIIFNRAGNRETALIGVRTLRYLSSFAEQNYVVLASQYRGNDGGEGREAFGGEDINDVLNLIDVAKSLDYVDAQRIAMLGYSRGGMMTFLAMKEGAPLKAAAVVGAPTDLTQTYEERDDLKPDLIELVGGSPQGNRDAYFERSACYWPEKLEAPLLILHGDKDWRVDVSQSRKLVEKLIKLNARHKYVEFPGADHNLSTERKKRDALILQWFAKYV